MNRPLVVDLDGTLLRSDVLFEAMLRHVKQGLGSSIEIPLWILGGKASLKEQLSQQAPLDVTALPYNEEILDLLRHAKAAGRKVVLATATHRTYADQIAEYLGCFDKVIATEQGINLSAKSKCDRLTSEFGHKGFDYIGNSHDDLPVWQAAGKAYLADPDFGVESRARTHGNVVAVFQSRRGLLQSWLKALRPHQWMKNLLLFIPLLAAHHFTDVALITQALLAFIFFSMSASSGYLFNDLLDLESDRHHARKRKRPLASGDLPIQLGIASAPLLFIAALAGSLLLLPHAFSIALGVYYILTLAYSQKLKQIMGIDTLVLAGLYTVRIIAGAYACNLVPTFWILAFSMFLFLSLAMVKRYAELHDANAKGETEQTRGRGYFPADLDVISNLGVSAGYLSVLVLALYIQDARTIQMYQTHELIWLACPILLFWISRVWMIAHRGQMHDDPVLYAVKDKVSLMTGAAFAAVFILATIL